MYGFTLTLTQGICIKKKIHKANKLKHIVNTTNVIY
jgi:hypothetical protein